MAETLTPQQAYDGMTEAMDDGLLKRNNFIDSMCKQFERKAFLSEKQIVWATKFIIEATTEEDEPYGEHYDFVEAFKAIQSPKLIFEHIRFSPAPAHGQNAGHIYVKYNNTYVGKITPMGDFKSIRDFHSDNKVNAFIYDMMQTGIEVTIRSHGHTHGNCCCCGKELTDIRSVTNGVGPVCAKRWNMAWG